MNDCFKCKNEIIDADGYPRCKFTNEIVDEIKYICKKFMKEW